MIKACCISEYTNDKHERAIRAACAEHGYDIAFYRDAAEAEGHLADVEVAYLSYHAKSTLAEMRSLKWCHVDSAGVTGYIYTGIFDDGAVKLTNSSGAFGRAISEHIIMFTLMLMRKMPEYQAIAERREWKRDLPIRSIAGSRIAIVGTGDLGRTAAANFKGLGAASVIGFNRSGKAPVENNAATTTITATTLVDDSCIDELNNIAIEGQSTKSNRSPFDSVHKMDEFEEYAGDLDVLVMCVPDTPSTRNMLNAERIAALPETAYIINVGRGVTIDQDALIEALNEGRIAGAALDVVVPEPLPEDHPLWDAKNCIITPHCSGDMGLEYSVDKTFEIFCKNLGRYAHGEDLINQVDPSVGY